MAGIQAVTRFLIQVKFRQSLHMLSVTSDAFTLHFLDGAEDMNAAKNIALDFSTQVTPSFKPVSVNSHYDSVSRVLDLYFADIADMQPGFYAVEIIGLKDAIGRDVHLDGPLYFKYDYDNSDVNQPKPKPQDPVDIVDRSIKQNAFLASETIRAANPDFHITGTDPINGDIFVAPDHRSGRITVTFSSRPSSLFVNSDYITVQRKKVGFPISRWETVKSRIKLDSSRPRVYIAIPSIETKVQQEQITLDEETSEEIIELVDVLEPAGQYEISGLDYFEPQYKYRVRIASDFGKKVS